MTDETTITTGGCLCGAVRYQVSGPLRDVVNCYCSMCQKLHGSFGAHSKALKKDITLIEDRGLKWYRTSSVAQRGFCGECGSSLFWKPDALEATGILAGSLDQPTGLATLGHIFVGEKADFYEIEDTCPQFEKSSDGALIGDSL
ncbi:MAG: GFA family protein [Sneathiella sp.]|nr:GFA family protein [Sneathiella sp.]